MVKIIISKDALCKDYLHFYGSRVGQSPTPNIDALIDKGTLFYNYYTAAPSTVMSFYSMSTGKFAHETEFEMYERIHFSVKEETIFLKAKKKGYDSCHIIWDDLWGVLPDYFDYFTNSVLVHNIRGLRESVGVHKTTSGEFYSDNKKARETLEEIEQVLIGILNEYSSPFIWLHLPHVLSGRACYGADIDLFDEYVGMVRKHIDDKNIIITADHGNMNGLKGKLAYGFDVYNKVISIPLIVPRIDGHESYKNNVSSVDLYSIVFERQIPTRKFVYCDSAYRAQKSRKLAIIYGKYKYIYNKKSGKEELYDLEFDPNEDFSLMNEKLFDVDRKINVSVREEYFYPEWDKLEEIRELLRTERKRVWKNGSTIVVIKSNMKDAVRPLYNTYIKMFKK